ncbi:MAG: glycosyltransferase [Clostridia bacterium]|nr:glycosyltransferase [Clostridia bacterium]
MKSKIKILVAFIHVHTGGAMTSLVNFLNSLDTDKYEVDVIFYKNDGDRCGIKDEINILPQGKAHEKYELKNILRKIFSPSYVAAKCQDIYYKKIVKNKKKAVQIMSKQGYKFSPVSTKEYDVAVAYEFAWPMNYVMNSVNAKKKILWHHLEFEKSGLDFNVDKKAMDDADALVFVSEDCRSSYNKNHPEHSQKTYFIPNILSSGYVRAKGHEDALLPFEYTDDDIKFLSVARIKFDHKGFDRAVRAFARLKSDGLLDNVKWLIIGNGSDLPALKKMIAEYELQDCIYAIGERTNPIPYMKKFDALLLPSRYEGKPMVVTEGFIMGLVPVVTKYTSADEQIRDGVDGLVFDNNEEALYEGLKNLLQNPEVLKELKKTVDNTDYGNENEIIRFDELIDKLL